MTNSKYYRLWDAWTAALLCLPHGQREGTHLVGPLVLTRDELVTHMVRRGHRPSQWWSRRDGCLTLWRKRG